MRWENWCGQPPSDSYSLLSEPGYWGLMADPFSRQLANILSAIGLSNRQKIVVYADGQFSWGAEGRVAWMLLYLGAQNVSILAEGWRGWVADGGPVECEGRLCLNPTDFHVRPVLSRRARLTELVPLYKQGRLPLLVDTRSTREFGGEALDYHERNGHLPGSILFPFEHLFNADGSLISRERYLQIAPPEIRSARNLVAYCEVGVRASTFALLHEVYTGRTVPVFDGSLVEWAHYKVLPVLCS